jgi:hypothetical protein
MPSKKRKPKRKVKNHQPTRSPVFHSNLAKILATVLGLTATGGTALSYNTGRHADERAAVLETKVAAQEKAQDKTDAKVEKIDRRTIRIEEAVKNIGEKLGVKQAPRYGPDER